MKKFLQNLFIIYSATSVQWFVWLFYVYIFNNSLAQNTSTLPNSVPYLNLVFETLIFAAIFYVLSYVNLVRVRSAIGLFLTAAASDLAYNYVYLRLIVPHGPGILQDSTWISVAIFAAVFSCIVIVISQLIDRMPSVADWLASDDKIMPQFEIYGSLFLVGVAFTSFGIAFLQSNEIFQIINVGFNWQIDILLVQAVPITFTPFLYLLFLFAPGINVKPQNAVHAGFSAYIGFYLFLLPTVAIGALIKNLILAAIFAVVILSLAFYAGLLVYSHKSKPSMRAILWELGLIALVLLFYIPISVLIGNLGAVYSQSILGIFIFVLWLLVSQGLSAAIFYPFINVPVVILLYIGIYQIIKHKLPIPDRFYPYALFAVLFPTAISILATVFYNTQNGLVDNICVALVFIEAVLTVWLTVKEKGYRMLVFALGGFFTTWAFWTLFVASMAIQNSWI